MIGWLSAHMLGNNGDTSMANAIEERMKQLDRERITLQKELARTCANLKLDDEGSEHQLILSRLSELRTLDASKLINLTRETHEIATKMSANIRRRDLERTRLNSMIQLLTDLKKLSEDLRTLESSTRDEDLEGQCVLFHDVVASAKKIGGEAWACRYGEDEIDLFKRISILQRSLLERLVIAYSNNQPGTNMDERMSRAFETLNLSTMIGETEAGLSSVSKAVTEYASTSLKTIITPASTLDFRFAVKVGKVTEFIRGLVGWCRKRLLDGPGIQNVEEAHAGIVANAISEGESALVTVIRSFITERKVAMLRSPSLEGNSPTEITTDIRDLDLILAESAMIMQNCQRFYNDLHKMERKLTKKTILPTLDKLVALWKELIASYSSNERNYLCNGIKMALRMNEVNAEVSTCVEDVFFLAKKGCMRAVSVGERNVLQEIIEAVRVSLASEMIPSIGKRLRQLFPDPKSGGDCIIIATNDGASARIYLERLVDELRGVVEQTSLYAVDDLLRASPVMGNNLAMSKLNTVLNDLDTLADTFETVIVRPGLESIYSTRVKSKLSPFLVQLFTSEGGCTEPPSLTRCVTFIDKTLLPLLDTLIEENTAQIVMILTKEIVQQLEKNLLTTKWPWSPHNLVSFERDLRRLVAYLAELTGLQAKDLFVRSLQMLSVLEGEAPVDGDAPSRRLTDSEISILSSNRYQ